MAFDVFIHLGTLVAVIIYYRERISGLAMSAIANRENGADARKIIGMIAIASIPTAIIGFGLKHWVENLYSSPMAAAMGWIFTGSILLVAGSFRAGTKTINKIGFVDSLLIGIAQGIAVLPGVSRSGSTVAVGIFRGIKAPDAANFSFLMAIPAILGASSLQLDDLEGLSNHEWLVYLTGGVVAALVGYVAIWWLLKLLERRVIRPFGWYCLIAGCITILWYSMK